MPHFHIPLQSGSDNILKSMRRRYDTNSYSDLITNIKVKIPDVAIGVDVMVGFPGETESDFISTYNFIKLLDISYLHVFTYSERPNTDALNIDKIVSIEKRREIKIKGSYLIGLLKFKSILPIVKPMNVINI